MGEERITVGEVSAGEAAGSPVELPIVDILTGRGFITGKSGGGKSILEGTPVYTANGRKPIELVEEGERVLSLNKETYEQEFQPVQATIQHESDDLLRIELEDGTELVGTEDHSFLTVEDMEIVPIRGDEVSEGTWLPLARQLPAAETRTRFDLVDYFEPSNNTVIDDDSIRSSGATGDRYLDLDADAGRVLGLYLAEGSFDSKMTMQISATAPSVQSFLDENGFNVYERTCNRGFKPFTEFVSSEFGKGADAKRLPEWVYDTPESFRAGLLGGYFDGDGTVEENQITAVSKSPELIRGISELLRQFGVSTTVNDRLTLYGDERRQFRRLSVDAFSIPAFDDNVKLLIDSKRERLRALCDELTTGDRYNSKDMVPRFGDVLNTAARERGWTTRGSDERTDAASIHSHTRKQKVGRQTLQSVLDELDSGGRIRRFAESDIQWKRVVSVEPLDASRTVYDLDVKRHDNFIANGVFVHNSNSASVVAEKLLDRGYSILCVDIDGEYYGLKEEYEILHVGADEECDLQVSVEHAEKLASLALEQGVPIILDVSSFLDERDARELLKEVAKHLFAKEKKVKQPFLMLVEEIHEYIPEGGGMDECGRMLVKIGKRGRKHGLGIVGISQRPADVKKDFITQCDWLLWHRLTWSNDTKVAGRILGNDYRDRIEELDDGECFMMSDFDESLKQVQMERKRTFDAGATPGLDDFERPELKSVSADLVGELESITENERERESRIQELERELTGKKERIEELEAELEEARDLSQMAEQFSRAMMAHATGRPFRDDVTGRQAELSDLPGPLPDPTTDAEPGGEVVNPDPTDDEARERDAEAASVAAALDAVGDDATAEPDAGDERPSTETTSLADDAGPAAEATDGGTGRVGNGDRAVVRELRATIDALDDIPRAMVAYYHEYGPASPLDAHVVAGGDGDRTAAYRHNGRLREAELIEHAGRGGYRTRFREAIREAHDDRLDDDDLEAAVAHVEDALPPARPPESAEEWPDAYETSQ